MKNMKLMFSLVVFALSTTAFAGVPAKIPIEGRLTQPDGTPLLLPSTQIRVQIRSAGVENCLLYSETFSGVDLSTSGGRFSVTLNSGVGSVDTSFGWTFAETFKNPFTYTPGAPNCSTGSTYTATAQDSRKVQISVFNGGAFDDFPAYALGANPFAMQAGNADTVGNLAASSLIQTNVSMGFNLSQSNITGLFADASWTELQALIAGTSTKYAPMSSGNLVLAPQKSLQMGRFSSSEQATLVPTLNASDNGKMWFNSTTQTMMVWNGTSAVALSAGGSGDFMANGTIPMSGAFVATNGTQSAPAIRFNGDNSTGLFSPSTGVIGFSTGGQERLHLDPMGNLGVGTTAPMTLLDVNGAMTFRATSAPSTMASQGKLYFDSAMQKFRISENGNSFVDLVGGSAGVTNVSSMNPYISVSNGTSTPMLTLNVGTVTNTVAAGNDPRITNALSRAGDMMTGLLTLSADPSTSMHSATKQYVDSGVATAMTTALRHDGSNAMTGPMRGTGGSAVLPGYTFAADTDTGLYSGSAGEVGFSSNGVTALSISPSRNVSIPMGGLTVGSSMPPLGGPLYVHAFNDPGTDFGDAVVVNESTTAAPSIQLLKQRSGASSSQNGDFAGKIKFTALNSGFARRHVASITSQISNASSGNSAGNLQFHTMIGDVPSPRLTISEVGNVGIGTTAPSSLLHVSRDASGDTPMRVSNTMSNGSASLLLQGDGANLGQLSIYGSTNAIAPFQSKVVLSAGTSTSGVGLHSSSGIIGMYTGGGGVERMRIDAAGNVGIGTTMPSATLTVAGPIALNPPMSIGTGTYTVNPNDSSLIFASASTITLPSPSTCPGRILYVKNITAGAVTSSVSNVLPLGSGTAGSAILAATAGRFAMLQSDGTNWIVMMAN